MTPQSQPSFFRRFGPGIAMAVLLAMPCLLVVGVLEFATISNNVVDWLPENFDETAKLKWFYDRFRSDEILVVSWPGCTLDDKRLVDVAERLRQPFPVPGGDQPQILFRQVFTGRETLQALQDDPVNLPPDQALKRMRGWLLGPDGQTTAAVALVSEAGFSNRHAALAAVKQAAIESGVPVEQLKIGGSTADSVAIDVASQQGMIAMLAAVFAISLILAWLCLRSAHILAAVGLTASFAWALSLAMMYFTSTRMDAVLLMMPGLIFVCAVSGAIHLSNYYKEVSRQDPLDAPSKAVRHAMLPCVLACVTTSIGGASLMTSHLRPVFKFGLFSAIGVLFALFSLMIVWPSTIHLWMAVRKKLTHGRAQPEMSTQERFPNWWFPFWWVSTKFYWAILALVVIAVPIAARGLSEIKSSARLEDLLAPDSELIQGYLWLQDQIGPLVPAEVVVQFPPSKAGDAAERRELLRRIELIENLRSRIDRLDKAGGTTAASTFVVDLPTGSGGRQLAQRSFIASQVNAQREELKKIRYLYEDDNEQSWRISTRFAALGDDNYGELLAHLEKEVHNFLEELPADGPARPTVQICGAIPLIYKAQQQMLDDLMSSFGSAFLMIALAMMVVLRRPVAGLLAMVPNALPVIVVFGTMGLLGRAVDIGAMMTASLAMGIAVDDTLHYLSFFRRAMLEGKTKAEAIRWSFAHCATPMAQTAVIVSLGLFVFVASPFVPTARFSWLMASLLTLGVLTEFLVTPAILASPLGWFFIPWRIRKTQSEVERTPEPAQV